MTNSVSATSNNPWAGKTPRQCDTLVVRQALNTFATTYPAAGEVLAQLGPKALDQLTEDILLALHPRATDMYSNITATFYDMAPGVSI